MSSVIMGTCALCGQVIEAPMNYAVYNGKYICGECEETGYFECCDCGELHYMDDKAGDYDGAPLCNDCYENNGYWTCYECGDIFADGDECISIDNGDEYVCDSCADGSYYHCEECGNYFSDRNMQYYGGNMEICNNCSCDYYQCEDCGDVFYIDNGSYSDRDGCWYCDRCYNQHRNDDSDLIWDYSDKPDAVFHNTPGDMRGDDYRLYIGVENEISGRNAYINDAAQEIRDIADESHIYMKSDCSIDNGFEMVSHPCTLDYHMKEFPWNEIFRAARNNQFDVEHHSCGLHCHVNRRFFGPDKETQDLHIAKLILVVEKLWDDIAVLARRDSNGYARKPSVKYERGDDACSLREKYGAEIYDRYYAINVTNSKTVEFRMFRNTLDHSTFIATLQFVDTICRYVKRMSISDIATVTIGHIIASAPESMTELRAYCGERCVETYAVETVSVAEIPAPASWNGDDIINALESVPAPAAAVTGNYECVSDAYDIEIPAHLRDPEHFLSSEFRAAQSRLLNMGRDELREIVARHRYLGDVVWGEIINELRRIPTYALQYAAAV